jgi:N-sulfoglucosamine sulfohydrolase
MNRRTFLKKTGVTAASLSVAPMLFAKSSTKSKRNIILYVADDQGSGDAGCYGNPVIKTPGLDYLAEHGTCFTNAFCTTASCSPSRSVILSGLHNHANGMFGLNHAVHHFQSFDNFKSLPVRLSEAGYRTMCAGKYHVNPEENKSLG